MATLKLVLTGLPLATTGRRSAAPRRPGVFLLHLVGCFR
jgi:hypothetical protein